MNNIHYYCTYFDIRYLPRALALYYSLREHDRNFKLWALCFDNQAYVKLIDLQLPNIIPIALDEFLKGDDELIRARDNRTLVEFYFTCTPSLPLYVLKKSPEVDQITYLDSDLYFFNDPQTIFNEIGSASISIIPHQFPEKLAHLSIHGIFNVSWLTFRRDDEGLTCLQIWRQQCLEWCFDYVDGTRYADQGYLNDWPQKFTNIIVMKNKGANLAPWNLERYQLTYSEKAIWVDEDLLVFFHFQNLARVGEGIYKLNFHKYLLKPTRHIKKYIYALYLKVLETITVDLNIQSQDDRVRAPLDKRFFTSFTEIKSPIKWIKNLFRTYQELFRGDYMFPRDY